MARVLVVDDDQQVRKFVTQTLARTGHEVVGAADGNEGLAAFKGGGIDIVVIDLIMPEKEGIETIIELRRINKAVKIIAISGGGRMGPEGYLLTAKSLGAKETLQKPFSMEELSGAVERVLQD